MIKLIFLASVTGLMVAFGPWEELYVVVESVTGKEVNDLVQVVEALLWYVSDSMEIYS